MQNVGLKTEMEDTKLKILTLVDVNIEIFHSKLGCADVQMCTGFMWHRTESIGGLM